MNNQKRKVEPVFVVGVILFLFAIGVYAYNGYLNRKMEMVSTAIVSTSTPSATGNQIYGTSSAPVAVVPVTSTPAASSAPARVTTITPAKPVTPTPPPSAPISSTLAVDCNASSLDGSVTWQATGDTVIATAKISNRGDSNCELSGFPLIGLISGNTILGPMQSDTGADSTIVIRPSQSAFLHFTWSNWCKSGRLSPIQARIVFSGNNGYLQIPVIDANGAPQSNAPRCNSASEPSMISVSSYSQG